jgi:hypothetical protein
MHIGDLKAGNPVTAKQLDDLRQSVAASLARTQAEQQRSGRWESIALAGTAVCFVLGGVVGLAIGVRTRRDHFLQQTPPVTAGTNVKE